SKPTHMIGGYAQLAYGFNYYGTVGSNRDEFIMIRKMKTLTGWMMRAGIRYRRRKNRNTLTGWDGTESR
ncbi:nitrate reductase Z subunit alpha, partial [Salmonella enterica subsp. enterica serovar Heidelberg str. N4403]